MFPTVPVYLQGETLWTHCPWGTLAYEARFAVPHQPPTSHPSPGVVFRFPLKVVLCNVQPIFDEFIFDEMILSAKPYKVQLWR